MPPESHLRWAEIRDFAPGLWSASPHLMAGSAAQTMDNCEPYAGGGLRAFFTTSSTYIPSTGIVAGGKVSALRVRPNVGGYTTDGRSFVVAVFDSAGSTNALKIYRFRTDVADTGWTLVTDRDSTTANSFVFLAPHFITTGSRDMEVFSHEDGGHASAEFGTYAYDWDEGLPATLDTVNSDERGPIAFHQSRLVVASREELVSTPVGALGFGEFVALTGFDSGVLTWLQPYAPSDLLVGTKDGTVFNVQGDLADPSVREIARFAGPVPFQTPASTPHGTAVMVHGDGVYLIGPDGGTAKISDAIPAAAFAEHPGSDGYGASLGTLAYAGGYLFVPGGYVYSFSAKSWLRVTAFSNCRHFVHDPTIRGSNATVAAGPAVIGATDASPPTFPALVLSEPDFDATGTLTRASTFTWKSAPLRDPSGRQLEIREVQLTVQAYGTNNTMTVTVNGTARAVNVTSTGRHQLRFLFRERGAELDVQVVSNGNSSEAPTIETVRIGTKPGHLF